jgi:hypothetical protein
MLETGVMVHSDRGLVQASRIPLIPVCIELVQSFPFIVTREDRVYCSYAEGFYIALAEFEVLGCQEVFLRQWTAEDANVISLYNVSFWHRLGPRFNAQKGRLGPCYVSRCRSDDPSMCL